jgi:hypothetical protein
VADPDPNSVYVGTVEIKMVYLFKIYSLQPVLRIRIRILSDTDLFGKIQIRFMELLKWPYINFFGVVKAVNNLGISVA